MKTSGSNGRQSLLIHLGYVLIDVVCINLAICLVLLARDQTLPFDISWAGFFSAANPFKIVFLLWVVVILFFNQVHGLYHTHREMLESVEIWKVTRSVVLASLVVIVLVYMLKIEGFPRGIMLFGPLVISFLLSLWRGLKKLLINVLVQGGYRNFNAIIIGADKTGVLLAEEIQRRPGLGIKIVGFLDDEKQGNLNGWPVLGKLKDFQEITQRQFIHKAFITTYPQGSSFIRLLEEAKESNIAVRVVPQGFEYMSQDCARYNIGIVPILEYSEVQTSSRQKIKHLFDFVLSLILFCISLPVFVVLAIFIKWDTSGPVLYSSKRYGRHGRIFYMYKFRSMVANADDLKHRLKDKNEVDGPIFKIKKDPRLTRMGAWLRKYSLDELPQIINVLKGDMSLVGPRPFPIEQIEREDLRQLKRLNIRPGITGLWQIKGRSDLSFEKLLRWDIWYINNWSFGLDLYILFRTLPVVIQGKGAY